MDRRKLRIQGKRMKRIVVVFAKMKTMMLDFGIGYSDGNCQQWYHISFSGMRRVPQNFFGLLMLRRFITRFLCYSDSVEYLNLHKSNSTRPLFKIRTLLSKFTENMRTVRPILDKMVFSIYDNRAQFAGRHYAVKVSPQKANPVGFSNTIATDATTGHVYDVHPHFKQYLPRTESISYGTNTSRAVVSMVERMGLQFKKCLIVCDNAYTRVHLGYALARLGVGMIGVTRPHPEFPKELSIVGKEYQEAPKGFIFIIIFSIQILSSRNMYHRRS